MIDREDLAPGGKKLADILSARQYNLLELSEFADIPFADVLDFCKGVTTYRDAVIVAAILNFCEHDLELDETTLDELSDALIQQIPEAREQGSDAENVIVSLFPNR